MNKFLFVLHYPNPFPGAAWTRISQHAAFINNRGHEVSVAGVFSLSSLNKAGYRIEDSIRIHNFTPVIMMQNTLVLFLNILSSIITSCIIIGAIRPNFVIISVPYGETALGAYIAAYFFRRKIFFDYRDEWEDAIITSSASRIYRSAYRVLKRMMTRCYVHSNLVVTVTETFAQKLLSRGVQDVKIVTNGADLSVFMPRDKLVSRTKIGLSPNDFVFIFSGIIGSYYRLDIVVKALQKMNAHGCVAKLLMVGHGSEVQRILDLSVELGLQDCVVYLGAKRDKIELAEIICSADAGIVPYDANPLWKNSMPVKALEYLACGIPVIASAYQDSLIGGLILDNQVGFICTPEDSEALSLVMEKVARNEIAEGYRERALSLVKERYDRKKLAERFLELIYDSVRN